MCTFAAPENDEAMHHLMKLREKLGWKTEIPRHAPGCKENMDKLKNIPDNEKVGGENLQYRISISNLLYLQTQKSHHVSDVVSDYGLHCLQY